MNAGAHGKEIKDILIEAEVIDSTGNFKVLSLEEMEMSYRHCEFKRLYFSQAYSKQVEMNRLTSKKGLTK